jgi:hypothetical protein
VGYYSGARIDTPFQVTPSKFLSFAKSDFRQGSKRHQINSLSNTKRAIGCQVDSLLFSFGLLTAKRKNWSLPMKLKMLTDLGIVAPNVLRRINKLRNVLEHEYSPPSKDEIASAIDVAELFIQYTNQFILDAWKECELYAGRGHREFQVAAAFDYRKGVLESLTTKQANLSMSILRKTLKKTLHT